MHLPGHCLIVKAQNLQKFENQPWSKVSERDTELAGLEEERAKVPESLGHLLLLLQLLVPVPPRAWALLEGVGKA